MNKYRTGTVLRFKSGNVRIERVHQRNSGPTYDIMDLSSGKRSPEYMEAMIAEGLRQAARFSPGDQALWKNRACRIAHRGWNVASQDVRYTIELDDRTLKGIPEHDLSVA